MFFPRQRHQNAHPRTSATIEEPTRRRMINPHNVHASLAHQRQIGIDLFRPADIISILIRFERAVRDTFDEKLAVPVEKKLRSGTDSRVCRLCHVEPCSVIPSAAEAATQRTECARPGFPSLDSPSSRLRSAFAQSYDRASEFAVRLSYSDAVCHTILQSDRGCLLVGRAVLCTPVDPNSSGAHGGARPTDL